MIIHSIINYLFYSSLVLPSNETVCKGNTLCPIEWDSPLHGHIELQLAENNSWSSTTDIGKSFLSVIVDESSTSYEWDVPQYITQFWQQPKRVVLADLESGEHFYSDNFTITGITLETDMSGYLNSQTTLPITWSSNDNSQSFGIYMIEDNTIIETIEDANLPANYTYYWDVPYKPNINFSLLIRSSDNNTFVRSSNFEILATTTLTTTATTSTTATTTTTGTTTETTTPTTTIVPTNEISDAIIALIIIISLLLILCLAIYLYINCCLDGYTGCCYSTRVHPQPITRNNVSNPVYEPHQNNTQGIYQSAPGRNLPPLPPITHTRQQGALNNGIYEEIPHYSRLKKEFKPINAKNIVNYNHLSRTSKS